MGYRVTIKAQEPKPKKDEKLPEIINKNLIIINKNTIMNYQNELFGKKKKLVLSLIYEKKILIITD